MIPAKALSIILVVFGSLPILAQCGGHGNHGGHGKQQPTEKAKPKVKATNIVCPVLGNTVSSEKDREVWIRGRFYLICCDKCANELADDPDKYLDKDGKPKNVSKPKKEESSEAKPKEDSCH